MSDLRAKLDKIETIAADRERIVDAYIRNNYPVGRLSYSQKSDVERLMGIVFHEAGWDVRLTEQINDFATARVVTFDPEAMS